MARKKKRGKVETEAQLRRRIARTPILTPSEVNALALGTLARRRIIQLRRESRKINSKIKRQLKAGRIRINKQGKIVRA